MRPCRDDPYHSLDFFLLLCWLSVWLAFDSDSDGFAEHDANVVDMLFRITDSAVVVAVFGGGGGDGGAAIRPAP